MKVVTQIWSSLRTENRVLISDCRDCGKFMYRAREKRKKKFCFTAKKKHYKLKNKSKKFFRI